MMLQLLVGDVDCWVRRIRVEAERLDDLISDDVGLKLNAALQLLASTVVLQPQVEREGSDEQKHCRPEAADCTPDCTHRQADQNAEECCEP